MSNFFSKFFTGKRSAQWISSTAQNPWVKEGDYIYLHSQKGLYRVVSVSKEGFEVVKGNPGSGQSEFHTWDDFKRWSGRPVAPGS